MRKSGGIKISAIVQFGSSLDSKIWMEMLQKRVENNATSFQNCSANLRYIYKYCLFILFLCCAAGENAVATTVIHTVID